MSEPVSAPVTDTIFAIATPAGVGGVAVVRVSGPLALDLGAQITGKKLRPRYAEFCHFKSADGDTIDSGLALAFPGPASFTGEHVLELQGHGGDVVPQMVCRRLAELGARPARPGEFSERAFLNDKLDLAQAEAVADLVAAGTEHAARAAQRSLEGVFSRRVDTLQAALTDLRVFVEAALDFPDEEIDFIAESDVAQRLQDIQAQLQALQSEARNGQLLKNGVSVTLIGQPNAGKSSLLNALAGRDSAIVTAIPGTTRDVLRETISLDGLPVHIADTAGLREATDLVEQEGVRRARNALQQSDMVLLVVDASRELAPQLALRDEVPANIPCLEVYNKTDLIEEPPRLELEAGRCWLSAAKHEGLAGLVRLVHDASGLAQADGGTFSARARHLDALERTAQHLQRGQEQLAGYAAADMLAEELRLAQQELGEITGTFLPDDLLGAIFSSFCIGK